jgi:hypothetical protein
MKKQKTNSRKFDNFCALKALDEVDTNKAVLAISNPNLDRKELSEVLQASMTGDFVYVKDGSKASLSPTVLMAGLRNLLYQIEVDSNGLH